MQVLPSTRCCSPRTHHPESGDESHDRKLILGGLRIELLERLEVLYDVVKRFLVFTRSQYDRVIWADPLFRTTFSALFLACPILFVGFGLVDDNFESLFAQIRALAGDQPPRHFALMPKGALPSFRRTRVEQAGVRVIEYPNLDGKHSDVARILEWLAGGDPQRFP